MVLPFSKYDRACADALVAKLAPVLEARDVAEHCLDRAMDSQIALAIEYKVRFDTQALEEELECIEARITAAVENEAAALDVVEMYNSLLDGG